MPEELRELPLLFQVPILKCHEGVGVGEGVILLPREGARLEGACTFSSGN
jgi:hypothetical protein